MSRAKFKLGTLIQYKNEAEELNYGVIQAIVTHAKGFDYEVSYDEIGRTVEESQVVNAYRPFATRKTRTAKKTKTKTAHGTEARA
jgi:hypothetical protein